ncbi:MULTISPECIES: c-type cytochrome [Flavobacterium]|uniref:c-type cytochrome n=1 Tax=Flavobacterium TaxID=237 RepID=UPI0011833DE0|nr:MULTISPECIES: cytochrome c [Flavobacterium]MCR4033145.1 cytochrome c [Flavobacterium panacis]
MKRIRLILRISILLIIVLVGVIFYQIKYNPSYSDLNCQTPVPFCGTKPPELTEKEKEGQIVFNSNCAACHKLDARSTGPALRSKDSLVFVKWIIGKNHKIDTTKIEELGIDYHRMMFSERVKEKDLKLIIEYCSRERDY